jgi:hypothetical protein
MRIVSALVILTIISGCSTVAHKPNRKTASVTDTCMQLSQNIKDEKVLGQLGCSKDGSSLDVFTGSAEWTDSLGKAFDEVETGGIIMDAVQKAHRSCSRNHTLCVIKSVNLDHAVTNKSRSTSYTVIIHGVDSYIENSDLKKFDGTSSNYNLKQSSQLQLLSAQYGALSNALAKCYTDGYALCAIVGYNLSESNNFRDGNYYTSAAATVIGVNFARPHKTSTQESTYKINFGIPVPTLDLNAKNNGIEI